MHYRTIGETITLVLQSVFDNGIWNVDYKLP